MKNFLRSSESKYIIICAIAMVFAVIGCVKTQQVKDDTQQIKELRSSMSYPGITDFNKYGDGSCTFIAHHITAAGLPTSPDNSVVTMHNAVLKVVNNTTVITCNAGVEINNITVCPPTCPPDQQWIVSD